MNLEVWTISEGSFHFGLHGLGQEESGIHFPSDSLFAALVSRLAEMQGGQAAAAWVGLFRSPNPPLALTSAFPRAGKVLFFPVPLAKPTSKAGDGEQPTSNKKFKRVRFVSEGVFRELLKGSALSELFDKGMRLNNALVVLKEEVDQLPAMVREKGQVWSKERRPRVTISRTDSKSNLFFTGHTVYAPGCGLWLGVRWVQRDEATAALLNSLLQDLSEAGIGGDRSSGFGHAEFKPSEGIDLPDPSGNAWVALSRYLPAENEMTALHDERAAYSVETIRGWLYSQGHKSERRRQVRMLAEGSVFGPLAQLIPGQVAEVHPIYDGAPPLEHPVLRNGLTVAVGIQLR
jgi:CRISPR-associated protein Csm4